MATAREARAGRLNERLRGAQRANVGDDETFNLDLGAMTMLQASVQSSSSPTATSSRRPQARNSTPVPHPTVDGDQRAPPSGNAAVAGEDELSSEAFLPGEMMPREKTPSVAESGMFITQDEPEPPSQPSSAPPYPPRREARALTEEVTESPAAKPGSGRRRPIPTNTSDAAASRNRSIPSSEPPSSPTLNKGRRSNVFVRPAQPPLPPVREGRHENTPPDADRNQPRRPTESDREPEYDEPSDEEAVDLGAKDAAKIIGPKRPRPSPTSPELGSEDSDMTEEHTTTTIITTTTTTTDSVPDRKRKSSPATQRRPTKKAKTHESGSKKQRYSSSSDQNDDAAVEITVQRLVNNFPRDPNDQDDLQPEIPFANRGGETVVDVFAQVCEEVISSTLTQLQQLGQQTTDPEKKKECRIKMRAIAAYREELNSRLLQHAIHLNHWHSLRRRLRHVQKEKLGLRDEIIRLKGEREQVALRMDAIRIKYEADSKESTVSENQVAIPGLILFVTTNSADSCSRLDSMLLLFCTILTWLWQRAAKHPRCLKQMRN